jgi:hypothetical protein
MRGTVLKGVEGRDPKAKSHQSALAELIANCYLLMLRQKSAGETSPPAEPQRFRREIL